VTAPVSRWTALGAGTRGFAGSMLGTLRSTAHFLGSSDPPMGAPEVPPSPTFLSDFCASRKKHQTLGPNSGTAVRRGPGSPKRSSRGVKRQPRSLVACGNVTRNSADEATGGGGSGAAR
jgi:hypothetical protein